MLVLNGVIAGGDCIIAGGVVARRGESQASSNSSTNAIHWVHESGEQFANLDKALQSLPPPAVDVVIENSSIKDNVVITGGGQLTLKRVPVDTPNVDNGTPEVQLPGASATDSEQDGMGPLPTSDDMEDRDNLKEGSPVVEEGRKTGLDDDSQATLEEEDAGQDAQSSTSS